MEKTDVCVGAGLFNEIGRKANEGGNIRVGPLHPQSRGQDESPYSTDGIRVKPNDGIIRDSSIVCKT